MASMAYPKSYEFERISYTAHSITRENDDYNLIFNFFNISFYSMHSIFNLSIFVTERKGFDQILADGTNNFVIDYPQVSQQKSADLHYFLSNISVAIIFAIKQLQKSNKRNFSLF